MAATTLSADPAIRALQDRSDITDVLYRYASTIDRFDLAGLRAVLADDVWAQYGNADPVAGGDAVAELDRRGDRDVVWQHHLLSVYHVEVDGDRAERARLPHVAPGVRGRSGHGEAARRPLPQRAAPRARRLEDQQARARDPVGRGEGGRRRLSRARSAAAGLRSDATMRAAAAVRPRRASRCATGSWAPPTGAGWSRTGCRCPTTPSTGAAGRPAARRCSRSAGTVTAPESTWRRRITTEAWRPEAVPGMAARAEAIRAEGAVAACQLVHLGRETTGAEHVVPPGRAVGGALAARADAAAAADRRRARRDRRGLPRLGGQRRRRRASRSSSCTPRTATCSPSSCRRDEPPAGRGRRPSVGARRPHRATRSGVGARGRSSASGSRSTAARRRADLDGLRELLPLSTRSPTT